ncbi:hypothetical protein [Histophilus somni]|uniref:hypothetical protein n=1 Tax=Histophilus somni TaxID=731 RepID=UPI00201F6641|nr:hypothetical protein [Histophilus somni]
MTQDDLINQLEALKKDLTNRPNDKAITGIVSRHIHTINECMEYGYSRKDIYDYIFDDHGKEIIKLDYFNNNILYRARKKNKKLVIQQSTNNRSVFNETVKQTTNQHTIIKNNPLADLSTPKETKQLHSSASDKKSLDDRIARMIAEREGN